MSGTNKTLTHDKKMFDKNFEYPRSDIEYFKKNIVPIMDKFRDFRDRNLSSDTQLTVILSELRKKGITLNYNTANMIVDRMAIDRIPQNAWDYITQQVGKNTNFAFVGNLISKGIEGDSALEKEISQRAKAFYNPNLWESLGAISATTLADAVTEAPLTIYSGGTSVIWDAAAATAVEVSDRYASSKARDKSSRNAYIEQMVTNHVQTMQKSSSDISTPQWMQKAGLHGKTMESASDAEIKKAKEWADANAAIWKRRYEMVKNKPSDEKSFQDTQSGKLFTNQELLTKAREYRRFSAECSGELNHRNLQRELHKQSNKENLEEEGTEVTFENLNAQDAKATVYSGSSSDNTKLEADPWGIAIANWKKNSGLEELLKHPGSTIASIPDVLIGMFTGKTNFNSDMLMPLACMISGFFTSNSLLKVPLIMGGAASIVGKVANEKNASQAEQEKKQEGPKYKHYKDVKLDPRISDPQLNGNTLMLDIDHSPYVVAISSTAVDAYHQGVLPLNVIANSVLANLDKTRQASREQQQQIEQSMQNNEREQNLRIK